MSTYTELKGLKVKYLAANPDPGTAGDVWYDSAAYALKGFVGRAAWSAGSAMSTGRNNIAGTGTQTAAIGAGGYFEPPATFYASTEEYNGSGWAAGGDLNTGRFGAALSGSQTATVCFGGIASNPNGFTVNSESYDGTTWTE